MNEEKPDPREWESLWNSVFDSFYSSYFDEMCSEFLIKRWKTWDLISKVLVGVTASTSAVSGWALWQDPFYKDIWAIIAGLSALIAIINGSMNVPEKIKEETLIFAEFKNLRMDLDQIKKKMSILAYDSLSRYKTDYLETLDRYTKISVKSRPDIFLTRKRQRKIQHQLNESLGHE